MSRRLDDTDLDNLEAGALGKCRGLEGVCFAHPADVLRLVEEVRWYRAQLTAQPDVVSDSPCIVNGTETH